jgi:antitoxin component HigA of HigAB toxin-antitoxin module
MTMDIRPIHDDAGYKAALKTASAFFDNEPEPGTPEADHFEVLLALIQVWESRHFPLDLPDPVEAIKFRMEQSGLSIKDLDPMIGRPNRIYEVLNRKRPLTLAMIFCSALFRKTPSPLPRSRARAAAQRLFCLCLGLHHGPARLHRVAGGAECGHCSVRSFLFAMLGHMVDWLGRVQPASLWAEQGPTLWLLGAVLLASTGVVIALQTIVKHQTLAINFPLRLRWNFHRLMLGQSMAFYSDEFAGRITTKVMQTALSVREMIFTSTDVADRHRRVLHHHRGAGRRL